jgi:hypothetical protein
VNLKTDQRRYKIFEDESYAVEKEPGKTSEAWRYYELRGNNGYIYSYSADFLGVVITAPRVTEKVKKAFDWPVLQSGTDETTFKVPDNHFEHAARFVKPRRKRIVSPGAALRLAKFQFKPSEASDGREVPL